MKLTEYEQWRTQNALRARPRPVKRWTPFQSQCEITIDEVEVGRARERQLIAEAERIAEARRS